MNRPSKVLALLAVAGALVAAGCGDDDEGEETTPSTTTTASGASGVSGGVAGSKEEWIATADEVCANGEKELELAAEAQGISPESSPEELQEFSETIVVPIQQSIIDSLRGLTPPEGEEEATTAIIEAAQSALDTVQDDPELLADPETADQSFDEADRLAAEYGLTECGD